MHLLSRRRGRWISIVLATLLLVLTGMTTGAGPASANELDSSSPSSGARLTSGPRAVRLTFSDPVLFASTTVSVTGPGGDATSGNPQVAGREVTQNLDSGLARGRYRVSWRVRTLFTDDSGSFNFTIASPAAARPNPRPTPTQSPSSPTPTASPGVIAPQPQSPSRDDFRTPRPGPGVRGEQPVVPVDPTIPAPAVQGVNYSGSDRMPPPIVIWGVLIVLGIIAYAVIRLRRRSH